MARTPQIYGVFSVSRQIAAGMGGTAKEYVQKTYWFVRRLGEKTFAVQPLNEELVPAGITSLVDQREFSAKYCPEIQFYYENTLPHLQSLKEKIERGATSFRQANFSKAEALFAKALLTDEENPKTPVRLETLFDSPRHHARLKAMLASLIVGADGFKEEQRRQCNVFGISLRKNKRFEEAVRIYATAIELDDSDENLHFNLARVYFENGNRQKAKDHLNRALTLNPEFAEARKFLTYCDRYDFD